MLKAGRWGDPMIRVADFVAERLYQAGVRDVFMVTGGAAMHLNDAFGRHPGLKVTCFHHEQAAAMAAESYFRATSRLAAVNVTAGPGATNAITGVLGAWNDSMGMIVVSGQVKRDHLVSRTGLPLRQFGDQEVDIVSMVRGVTKYAALVDCAEEIGAHVDTAIRRAVSGRPGPVWLDIPVDVQGSLIDSPPEVPWGHSGHPEDLGTDDPVETATRVNELLSKAERPVIYAGPAIRTVGHLEHFRDVVSRLDVPVVTALNAHDLLATDDPLVIGRPGIIGDRAGNLAVQNSDLIIVLGTRLKIGQVGYDPAGWAPAASVVMIDIDKAELQKPSFHVEHPFHCDLGAFLQAWHAGPSPELLPAVGPWLRWCQDRRERYPVCDPSYRLVDTPVNPYVLFEELFALLDEKAVVVAGNSWAGNGSAQAGHLKLGQRLWANSGCGSMGHDLPAAIGAAIALPDRTVVCLAGDGSLQFNIQELQTVVHNSYQVKLIVLNNGGYESIRQTQGRFFPDGPVGYDAASGISFPDCSRLAAAYGIPYRAVDSHTCLRPGLEWALMTPGPILVEVAIDRSQTYVPKSTARRMDDGTMVSASLEDLEPFLPPEETSRNVIPREDPGWLAGLAVGSPSGLKKDPEDAEIQE